VCGLRRYWRVLVDGCGFVLQVIELPVKHPELFESLGIDQPKVRKWVEFVIRPQGYLGNQSKIRIIYILYSDFCVAV